DAVAVDEMLCELETDKVTVEVPAPAAGVLGEIVAAEGDTVGVDALLAMINAGEGAAPAPAAAAEAPAAGGGDAVDVMVPTLGESVTEATVSTWFKAVGDTVAQDEMLCELETDKVSVEVPAPAAGVLSEIIAPEGTTVDASAKLAVIGGASASAAAAPAAAPAAAVAAPAGSADVENAPSANKLMAEKGIDAASVSGTGRDGRIMKEDVLKAALAPAAAAPAPAAAPRAPVAADDAAREERVKMTKMRQTIARRLKDSQNTAAMLTTYNEVDMTEVMALRSQYKDQFEKKHGVRLGFMSFFTKACVHALKEVPEVNAEIDGTDIVYKNYVHMGVAAGTPQGLVVPVIRDADAMSFADIEKAISEKGKRARDGKLSMAEMQGGTFTISNGGVYGSLMSSPILNPPQSGILGMHKIQDRPMAIN
ncbi:MAG: 2-oxoglutarate dehydrogenase complex dihydrolipoyllysine-residue succinyltransferase, partial [Pseudomonadota bacterium]|nr:2-oxoglutarate dehydrogenase complex dihydrolipoyllysine-residue succinyltransferase [Pseudomonadota bacterium]